MNKNTIRKRYIEAVRLRHARWIYDNCIQIAGLSYTGDEWQQIREITALFLVRVDYPIGLP